MNTPALVPLRRLEIITLDLHLGRICEKLDQLGICAYTVVRPVEGKGRRGNRLGDDLSGGSRNGLILIACTAEESEKILGVIRPGLSRAGGICLVSDVQGLAN